MGDEKKTSLYLTFVTKTSNFVIGKKSTFGWPLDLSHEVLTCYRFIGIFKWHFGINLIFWYYYILIVRKSFIL